MASSLPGMKKASRSLENLATMGKPDVIGSVRTFNNLSPERANRRALDDAGENWSVVGTCADGPGSSKAEEDGVLPDALDALMQGEQLSPIWRTQRNYGTFTRASFTYSAAVTDTSAASQKRNPAETNVAQAGGQMRGTAGEGIAAKSAAPAQDADVQGAAAAFREHTVSRGDSMAALAVRYGVSVTDIMRANGMTGSSQHSLLVRKTLRVPRTSGSAVVGSAAPEQRAAGGGAKCGE